MNTSFQRYQFRHCRSVRNTSCWFLEHQLYFPYLHVSSICTMFIFEYYNSIFRLFLKRKYDLMFILMWTWCLTEWINVELLYLQRIFVLQTLVLCQQCFVRKARDRQIIDATVPKGSLSTEHTAKVKIYLELPWCKLC